MSENRWPRVRTAVATTAVLGAVLASTTAAQAVIGGDESANEAYRFAARVQVGEKPGRACSGALVAPQWVVTARSCFVVDGRLPALGTPTEATTVTVGRTDLAATTGQVLKANRLVPHPGRDLLLVRLSSPVRDVPPVRLATAAPLDGEQLRVLGFGRTRTEWVPDHLHGASVTVGGVGAATVDLSPVEAGAATVCKGDAGGPTVRTAGGTIELIGIHYTSGQQGCLDSDGAEPGAVDTRVDDIASWIAGATATTCDASTGVVDQAGFGTVLPDFSGDCGADIIHQNTTGQLHGWRGSANITVPGVLFTGAPRLVGGGWTAANVPRIVVGDWNGDGRTDIMRQMADGSLVAWRSSGDFSADNLLFPSPSRRVGGGWTTTGVPRILTGDFNGDGRTDIAAVYPDGGLRAWASTGDLSADNLLFRTSSYHAGMGLTTTAFPRLLTGDFDGDGRTDLIGQDKDGFLRLFRSSGDISGAGTLFPAAPLQVGSGWITSRVPRILTGDFNGDGRSDIARTFTDGQLRVWASTGIMQNSQVFVGEGSLSNPGFTAAAYPRLLTGDLDRDGRTDIIAHNVDGKLHAWQSTGNASGPGTLFPGPSKVVGSGWNPSTYPRVF